MLLAKSCNILVGKDLIMVPVRSSVSRYLFHLYVFKIYFVQFLISPIHVRLSAHLIHSGICDDLHKNTSYEDLILCIPPSLCYFLSHMYKSALRYPLLKYPHFIPNITYTDMDFFCPHRT